jgi:membrane protein implicated in regulation of membrane protease activity
MWIWFGLAVAALIGEVASGTFYLLIVAVALAAAGVAAWLAISVEWQLVICAVVALLSLVALRRTGVLKKREINAAKNADVNLDIGQIVEVESWSDTGRSRVRYRGASWEAELAVDQPKEPGLFRISEIRGTRLILKRKV